MDRIRILITGSFGYIGTNLKPFLREKGYECVEIDRKIGNEVLDVKAENLKEMRIRHIIHLAAISGIKNCSENIKQAYIDNVQSTTHLFRESSKAGINVTFASSQAAKTPTANYYALTKYFGEIEAQLNNLKTETNINVLRFTNIYGGLGFLETKNTVVSKFAKAVRDGDIIVVNGNGDQERDFIHVYDVCRAIWLSTLYKCHTPIDIGTGVATSIKQLALYFGNGFTTDIKSDMIGTMRNVADVIDAKTWIGFKSEIELQEQIKKEFITKG